MILTIDQIKNVLKENQSAATLIKAREYRQKMRMHLYGEEMNTYLPVIGGFEAPALQTLRVKYAKSNRDLFTRLSRPLDKVFSARGGSVYYNLEGEQEDKARQVASNIRSGMSVKDVLSSMWRYRMIDDPMGIMMMELFPTKEAERQKQMGNSICYPTFKSVANIHEYLCNGSQVEFVFFVTSKKERKAVGLKEDDTVYRLVDDAQDVYVKVEDESVTLHSPMPNYFGKVPAMLNSDILSESNSGMMMSFFDQVIELADEFLLKGSIKTTHDFLHAYPKYWEYADSCSTCGGTKYVDGKDCPDCKGTGKNFMSKVSDIKLLEWPSKDEQVLTPNVAGYVSPSEVYHKIAGESMEMLESLMRYTRWGVQADVKQEGIKTATQIVQDIKPEADVLEIVARMAEKRHKFLVDLSVAVNIQPGYKGSSVNYGRRFMLEGPDVLWEKYQDAKLKGVAISALDDMLYDYYEAKYGTDPVKLYIMQKLTKVEPFVHMTAEKVKALGVGPLVLNQKIFYGEWLSMLSQAELTALDEQQLRDKLKEYAAAQEMAPEPTVIK